MAEQQSPAPGFGARLDRIAARLSTRGFGAALFTGLVALLVVVMVVPMPFRLTAGRGPVHRDPAAPLPPTAPKPKALDPSWPHRLTFITDSVGLGAVDTLRSGMAGWIVRVRGRPALMVHVALDDLQAHPIKIERVVVVALGYNSLWEHRRRDYAHWADYFDRQVTGLLRYLRRQGARKIVWVTLRTPRRSVVPAAALWQYRDYAWYFPYVNEQLRALAARDPDLVLADWSKVSDHPGLTYDAIHLDPRGAARYAAVVKHAVLHTPFG